jgi:uncharacterized protein (TIGR03118 family)
MTNTRNVLSIAAGALLCAGSAVPQPTNSYAQTNIASDIPGMASTLDPNMINPWGLTRLNGTRQGSGWYAAYNGTGLVDDLSIVPGAGDGVALEVQSASGAFPGVPAGACVANKGFVFTTLDGTLQTPATSSSTMIVVNNSALGAVYTGCTSWAVSRGLPLMPQTLYAANSAGGVEAYDENNGQFSPVSLAPGAFVDPNIPMGFKPYGIYCLGTGNIWVAYSNGTAGSGQGYVDAFDENGNLLLSLEQGNWMNQPYGMVNAPASGFGAANKALLVAMTGSGTIAVFNPSTGKFSGFLKNSSGQPVVIQGIRGIAFGNGSLYGGPTTTLYFTAGIDSFTHGLFGSITAN